MNHEQKRALRGVVSGIGLIFLLVGVMTNVYSTTVGIIIALTIWVVVIPALGIFGFGAGTGEDEAGGRPRSSGLAIIITISIAVIVILLIISAIVGFFVSGSFTNGSPFVRDDSGDRITETRNVSGFSRVELQGSGDITIDQTGEESLEIKADEKVIENIETRVVGDTLRIEVDDPWQFWSFLWTNKRIKYHLTVDDLEGISVSGSGSIETKSLKADELDIEIRGSGKGEMAIDVDELDVDVSGSSKFKFSGKAKKQNIRISGSGDHNAKKLKSKIVDITISGSGNSVVNVTDELGVTISGSGKVRYLGSPNVSEHVSGSGSVSEY